MDGIDEGMWTGSAAYEVSKSGGGRSVSRANGKKRRLVGLSHGMEVVPIRIPPFSVFVGRGDMFQAGAGYEDYELKGMKLWYQTYVRPKDVKGKEGIRVNRNFAPGFKEMEK